jgi:predicted enzyme related to lactoylglutathione lyase
MPERDGYIPGVPCWIDTSHPDAEAVLPFYGGLFGWTFEDVMPADAPGRYYMARIRGGDAAAVGTAPEGGPPLAVWNTYIWVTSADDAAAKARDLGGAVVADPFDVMTAGRMAVLADPEGAVFSVWEAREHKGAQIVNEHGAVNFNGLATRDVERAKAFYGGLFGWETLDLPSGLMWTLPGYGDHLEERTPGLREQVASMGGPEGFIDVVAMVNPIADGDTETPPNWSVTFATDDADATAAKATELGGTVVAGPLDAPWVRMAVLQDPQGAFFIASQFVPENADRKG